MVDFSQQKAAVIGLGLIGGSFAAALSQLVGFGQVVGWDNYPESVDRAYANGWIHAKADSLVDAVRDADFIVLSMYINGIIAAIREIAPIVKSGAFILDVGSTKAQVVAVMDELPSTVGALGGHPMTGKLTAGVDGAHPMLFADAPFLLIETRNMNRESVLFNDYAKIIFEKLQTKPIFLAAENHDRLIALVSHIVPLVPRILVHAVENEENHLIWDLAAGGFREASKEASQEISFWLDVFLTNPDGIAYALRQISREMEITAQLIESGNQEALLAWLERAKIAWQKRYGDS